MAQPLHAGGARRAQPVDRDFRIGFRALELGASATVLDPGGVEADTMVRERLSLTRSVKRIL